MPRLRSLSLEEMDPELRALIGAEGKTERELRPMSIRAHHPELAKEHARHAAAVKRAAVLPARLRELVRLRIAFHNQCRSCMAMRYAEGVDDGVTEDLVCSLERPYEAPDLLERERVALRYADLMATNHLAIDEALYGELARHYSEKEIVELGMLCATCVGHGRLAATWNMIEDLPERFRDTSRKATPWGPDAWVTARRAKA